MHAYTMSALLVWSAQVHACTLTFSGTRTHVVGVVVCRSSTETTDGRGMDDVFDGIL